MNKSTFLSVSVFFVLLFSGCKKDHEDRSDKKIIRIGGLFSITGNWSSLGKNSQAAMNLALVDVNNYLEETGSDYQFETVVYDTQLDTSSAKSAIQIGYTQKDVHYFIGPQSSAEVAAIKDYANNNNILVISQGSTASSLSIPNDAIFRFCPGDAVEGAAISRTMYNSGKRMAITLARNDAGNIGLQNNVGLGFAALGGQTDPITPYATSQSDFTAIIQQIRTKIQQHTATFGADGVAVYIASFDESVSLFSQASGDPVLSSVKWYGGDGMVQSAALLADVNARTFAMSTGFFAPNFGLPAQAHPQLSNISSAIQATTGIEPDAYALSVYDAMWVLARTIASYPDVQNNFTSLKTEFAQEANQFFGLTGPVLLNANGDRNVGSFDYWGIVAQGGGFIWKVVGKSN